MPPPLEPTLPESAAEPATIFAYRWLLALGFPSETAAASVMPDLFTNEVRPPEVRPGRSVTAAAGRNVAASSSAGSRELAHGLRDS